MLTYELVDRRAVGCEDPVEWSRWLKTADRRVAETWIDDVRISTVFLGLDHGLPGITKPALFETMVFVGGRIYVMNRYSDWEEAEQGHAETEALIREEMDQAGVKAAAAWAAVSARPRSGGD